MRMLKTTAAICVSIVLKVTIVSVQMNAKCLKTTRPVNVQKVSRSRSIGQCALVSVNTKIVLSVINGYEVRANMYVYRKVRLMLRTAFIIVYVNKKFLFNSFSINRWNQGGS